ncbi:ribonuclease P protein component [Massilia sp. B-10]|nr:ribonuclease P protein component [Massilia sp. B-10]
MRPAQKSAHFVLYTRSNELPHARLGVVVAKRFAPRAVTRNTIKRVTRELFRVRQAACDGLHRAPGPPRQQQGRPGHHGCAQGRPAR